MSDPLVEAVREIKMASTDPLCDDITILKIIRKHITSTPPELAKAVEELHRVANAPSHTWQEVMDGIDKLKALAGGEA